MTLSEWFEKQNEAVNRMITRLADIIEKNGGSCGRSFTAQIQMQKFRFLVRDELVARAIGAHCNGVGRLPLTLSWNNEDILDDYRDGERVKLKAVWYDVHGRKYKENTIMSTVRITPFSLEGFRRFQYDEEINGDTGMSFRAIVEHPIYYDGFGNACVIYIDRGEKA